ncbi:hypothetical protein IFM89_037112 [Coptis chinensis]|uniref:RecA family profile 1 domain-containing protein n=1 Tax=Coptis chinensis TaxID=261450 RepID=A0A835HUQ6_9MAGN|nr:hypothetical protein IFM89_037112 [Coptis chinensis]
MYDIFRHSQAVCRREEELKRERERMEVRSWIKGDETAKEMVGRVLTERPLLLLPPLHRVPLRVGNVVEILGPSPSAKTQVLIQAAVNCILPKEWKGVNYGGLERLVMYIDLDCRFDIQRLSDSLKHHINQPNEFRHEDLLKRNSTTSTSVFDDELYLSCMRRFLYVRCYNSLEFLATLKTLRFRLEKEREAHGVGVHLLMIDSISAFYWMDRASTPVSLGNDKRRNLSLHAVVETVVQEIQKLLQVQPMLVLSTKATILGEGSLTSAHNRNFRKLSSLDTTDLVSSRSCQKHSYREYMPSTWQIFVTHRVLVQVLDEDLHNSKHQIQSTYVSQWLLPSLSFLDKFRVKDAGIYMVS